MAALIRTDQGSVIKPKPGIMIDGEIIIEAMSLTHMAESDSVT